MYKLLGAIKQTCNWFRQIADAIQSEKALHKQLH